MRSCVANSQRHCEQVLNEIADYVQQSRLDAELLDVQTDVFAMDEE